MVKKFAERVKYILKIPGYIICDNKAAIQITVNPMYHEPLNTLRLSVIFFENILMRVS